MELGSYEGYDSDNGSDFQGFQCPIALIEQIRLEMSLNGEFPEHTPYCYKAVLASLPTIMPSSHYTVSRDMVLVIPFKLATS